MEANVSRRQNWPPLSAFPKRHCIATSPVRPACSISLIEFIEDSLITRINLILKDEKDTTARLRLIVLLLLGFGERNPGLTRILTGHALMFGTGSPARAHQPAVRAY